MSLSAIAAFLLDASARPHPYAIPLLIVVAIAAGIVWWRTRPDRAVPPKIEIGEPRSCFRGETGFVRLPIANEAGDPAESVHARARVADPHEPDRRWLPLAWVQEPPEVPRGAHTWDYESEAAEATLTPNGRPTMLQVIGQQRGKDFCGIYTPDSFWEIGQTWPFVVEIDLRGSNVERRFRLRVTPDREGFHPKAELVDV